MTAFVRWFWLLLPANPVLVRIVYGAGRRRRHLWVRMGYLGSLIGMVLVGLLAGGGMGDDINLTQLAKAGTLVFMVISYGQVILTCLLAPLFMSGAIVQEQAGRTYDILLSTPLSNLQIVLGTLVGRLFFVLALLASGIPLFAVLPIFGGVPVRAVFVSFAVAGLSALVMGAVAVTLSVWRAAGRGVVFVFMVAVGAYLVAVYFLDLFLLRPMALTPGSVSGGTTWLTPLHPLLVLEASLKTATYHGPDPGVLGGYPRWVVVYLTQPFLVFSVCSVLVTTILIVASTIMVRRVDPHPNAPWPRLRWWRRYDTTASVGEASLIQRRPCRVWSNPVAWRESRARGRGLGWIVGRVGFVLGGLAAGVVVLVLHHRGGLPTIPDPTGGGTLPADEVCRTALRWLLQVELAAIVLVALYLSAGCVSREREDGTFDLILTTPMTPRQYIWGKLRGLVAFLTLLLVVPVVTLLMASLYAVLGPLVPWASTAVSDMSTGVSGGMATSPPYLVIPESPLLLMLTIVPFVALCVAVGMSWSLRAHGVLGAVAPAVGIVGCLAMVTGFCGSNAAAHVPVVGPVLNAFSPVTGVMMFINPWRSIGGFEQDLQFGRLNLVFAALIAGGGYSLVVYLMLTTMVQTFDRTVRRLSGGV